MRWLDILRGRSAHVVHAPQPYRGNVDGVFDGALAGWVQARDPASEPVRVGLYTRRGLLAEGVANIFRGDLKAAGIGTGHHAFVIPLSPALLRNIAEDGGQITVRVLDPSEFLVGKQILVVASEDMPAEVPAGSGDPLQRLLAGDLQRWRDLLTAVARAEPDGLPQDAAWPDLQEDAPHRRMFDRKDYLNGGLLPEGMTAYGDYVRYRYKLDHQFDTAGSADATAHFQNWYVAGYSTMRGGLRVPVPRDLIAWWNEPVLIPGQRTTLTRATWSFLVGMQPILQSMNFDNPDWVNWAVFWWAVRQSRAMHVEDCLVPETYAERLRRVPSGFEGQADAPSEFMLRLHSETPELAGLRLEDPASRRRLGAAIALMAAQRPDYLRFLPEGLLESLFAGGTDAALPALWRDLAGAEAPPFDRTAFEAALRLQGFDVQGLRFLNFTAEGDRLEAAALPVPSRDADPVDIQVIGPFEKASGLGQATRLSAQVLTRAGWEVNCVDFGLDNPAPEGFSRVGDLSGYRRAKVNLIHLNAESIPLAFAYQPDVFSGAYNIGYFFWELDSPAACHYLGMHMLDEIWVSTEYGASIFRPHAPGPVINVGMCFEDMPEIDRDEARTYLRQKTGFPARAFVFFVAFDSFSFVQRKNPLGTLKAFARAFEGVPEVRLVIKTQNRRKVADPAQLRIWERIDALVAADPRITIIDETLSYDDLLRLKAGADCYISLHKSEGWGFGMIEAMNLKLPVVCTGYSGNMDFCSDETAFLVGHTEVELEVDDYIFVRKGQKWAEPDIADAARQMRLAHDDAALRQAKAEAGHAYVRTHFSAEAIARRYGARMDEIMKGPAA
jgi:glycosyltransferase involved in cell wall biosynthesis